MCVVVIPRLEYKGIAKRSTSGGIGRREAVGQEIVQNRHQIVFGPMESIVSDFLR